MATATATVTPEGLALSPDTMAELNLKPGTQITITLGDKPCEVSLDIERLIRQTRGMFAGEPSMTDELIQDRREEDHHFNAKW